MFARHLRALVLAAGAALMLACGANAPNPVQPDGLAAGDGGSAAADGSTLKATRPTVISPGHNERVSTRRPTLTVRNAAGKFIAIAFDYEFEVFEVNNLLLTQVVTGGAETTSFEFPSDLKEDTVYRWRARARWNNAFGPWSSPTSDFMTPMPPPPPPPTPTSPAPGPGGPRGPFGPQRSIGVGEAAAIIRSIHDQLGINLGSRSSRESRVAFLFSAVAAVHYGHARFNPAGGDRDWCVKDAGGGRPPSDDVIVSCSTRDAWDLIASAGADGYSWHLDYIGRLPSGQNVYPPPVSSLP